MKKFIINIIITLLIGIIYYYFALPPINLTSIDFWFFIILLLIVYLVLLIFEGIITIGQNNKPKWPLTGSIVGLGILGIVILIILTDFILSPLFNAKAYSKRIIVNETDNVFTEDISEVNFNALPILDKDSSQKLGDRVMGQMPELVSQFNVSNLYTQINYNNQIIRITPLEYSDIFKYFTNHKDGIKGYITVDSVNGESKLTKISKGMKYMDSAIFSEDLLRHLRFNYPTKIFGEKAFEMDDKGNPYWIIPTIKYIGINLRAEVNGIIILNPITGESTLYKVEEAPTWVDHVYSADLIIDQLNNWGKYREGFINSIFGQKNVVGTTEGYNYTVMNDDVYLYTGITSAVSDEANIGFVLTNMRTKETKFYAVPGAEEFSAMASAEGQVQQMNYRSTFPLLINLNNHPTYFLSLKDNAGLVKMYAFIDVVDYQKVVVTDSSKGIEEAAKNYLDGEEINIDEDNITYENITVSSIKMGLIEGNSYYFITDSKNKKYRVSIKVNQQIPFIDVGTSLKIGYLNKKDITEIIKLELK